MGWNRAFDLGGDRVFDPFNRRTQSHLTPHELEPAPEHSDRFYYSSNCNEKTESMSVFKRAIVGFAGGALATVPMTIEFWAAWRSHRIDEIPPHKAARSITQHLHEPQLSWMSALAHLAVGGVAGAAYAVLVPKRFRGVGSGIWFGLAVWVTGYEVVMPAVTDIAPAHRDQKSRAATILIAHIIYGATLGLAVAREGRVHSR